MKQGFQQFYKVAGIFLKVPDMKDCDAARCLVRAKGVSYLAWSWGMSPKENFKIEHSEMPLPAFLGPRNQFPRQGSSSLKFSLKSRLINENGRLVSGELKNSKFERLFVHFARSCVIFYLFVLKYNLLFLSISKSKSFKSCSLIVE